MTPTVAPANGTSVRAIVVADGDVPEASLLDRSWPGWADGVDLVVAADGGALGAARLGLRLDLVVGDMDSLAPDRLAELRESGVEIETVAAEKDESDAELAILAALARGATRITVLGAFGGPRLDHALANIGLLAMPALEGVAVEMLDGRTRVSALVAFDRGGRRVERRLPGRPGDLVSLLPLGTDVEGVTTAGLLYPLSDEPLRAGPARGLSNVRTGDSASVVIRRGVLIVIETAGPAADGNAGGSAAGHAVEHPAPGPVRRALLG